jgi:hypothetical protein
MIREFLGIERNGMPRASSADDRGEGVCSAISKTVRERFEAALKSNGMIDRNMAKSDMIKLTLGLGPYAQDLGDSDLLSAAARITEFCTSLMWQDSGAAMQAQNMGSRLNVLA